MRPTLPPIQWVQQTLYPGIKQRVNDFDHSLQFGQSPQSSARLKMGHSDIPIERTGILLPARSLYAFWSGERPFLSTFSFLGQMFSCYIKLSSHCLLLTEASEYWPCKDKVYLELHLKFQLVPRTDHTASVIKITQLMMHMTKIRCSFSDASKHNHTESRVFRCICKIAKTDY